MFIKANGEKIKLIDMDDYLLIDRLPEAARNLKTLQNYYLKDEINEKLQSIVSGELELTDYVMDKELTGILKDFITDIEIQYCLADSGTVLENPDSMPWSPFPPAWVDGKYMWQRMIVSYPGLNEYDITTDLAIPSNSGVCISGAQGKTGEKGQSLVSVVQQWYSSSSNVEPLDGEWSLDIPVFDSSRFVWSRFELTWAFPDEVTHSEPILNQLIEQIKVGDSNHAMLDSLFSQFQVEVRDTYQTIDDMQNYYTKTEIDDTITTINDSIEAVRTEAAETYATKKDTYTKNQVDTLHDDMNTKMYFDIRAAEENVANSGKANLIKNGDFYNGLEEWLIINEEYEGTQLEEAVDYPSGKAIVINGELNRGKGILQTIYPVTNLGADTFTMSCMLNVSKGADGKESAFRLYAEIYYIDKTMEFYEVYPEEFGKWTKVKKTFTTDKIIDHIEIQLNVIDSERILKASEIMLEYGILANRFVPSIYEMRENLSNDLSQLNKRFRVSDFENDAEYISFYDIYMTDDDGAYLLDEDGYFLVLKYASAGSVQILQNEVTDLRKQVADLQSQVAMLLKRITNIENSQPEVTVATIDNSYLDYCYTADAEANALKIKNNRRKDV